MPGLEDVRLILERRSKHHATSNFLCTLHHIPLKPRIGVLLLLLHTVILEILKSSVEYHALTTGPPCSAPQNLHLQLWLRTFHRSYGKPFFTLIHMSPFSCTTFEALCKNCETRFALASTLESCTKMRESKNHILPTS